MIDKEQTKEVTNIINERCEAELGQVHTNSKDGKVTKTVDTSLIAKDIINAGYHKTVWHKVADGDLPKNANYVLVAYHYYSLVSYAIACYKGQLSNDFRKWSTTDDYFKYDDDVIAWTELPEYKE